MMFPATTETTSYVFMQLNDIVKHRDESSFVINCQVNTRKSEEFILVQTIKFRRKKSIYLFTYVFIYFTYFNLVPIFPETNVVCNKSGRQFILDFY